MGNSPQALKRLVRHARYAPAGERGFFGASRAVRYGFCGDIAAEQQRIDRELCLMAQIETRQAVERVEALCAVPGVDAVFFGLGDLSATYGMPGQVGHPEVVHAAELAMTAAKRMGKLVAIMCGPKDAVQWSARGADLIFCGSDVACLRTGVQSIMRDFRACLAEAGCVRT